MLIKDLRGTESTQDACAKMRVGCVCAGRWGLAGMGGNHRGTRCSPLGPSTLCKVRGRLGPVESEGLGLEKGHSQAHSLFPLEIHRAHEEDPHYLLIVLFCFYLRLILKVTDKCVIKHEYILPNPVTTESN